jgi:hypothetical protein
LRRVRAAAWPRSDALDYEPVLTTKQSAQIRDFIRYSSSLDLAETVWIVPSRAA